MKFSEPARMHLTNLQVPGVSDYYTAKLVHYTSFSLIHWLGVPAASSPQRPCSQIILFAEVLKK